MSKKDYNRQHYLKNREKRLADAKAYWEANKETIKERRRLAREDPVTGPGVRERERQRQRGHKSRPEWNRRAKVRAYGITVDDLYEMASAQGWMCAICLDPFVGSPPIDHDHRTGEVRGLLCNRCNVGLGMFQDSPALLHAAVRYLDPAVPLEWDLVMAEAMEEVDEP